MRKFLLISAFLASNASAGQFWSDDAVTNNFIVADNILMLMDWAQTRDIANNPDEFSEVGMLQSVIGDHPTSGEVNRGYASLMIAWNAIGYFLPEETTTFGFTWSPKKSFWIGSTIMDGHTVHSNAQIGVKMEF